MLTPNRRKLPPAVPTPPIPFWVMAVNATGIPVAIRPSTRLEGIWVEPPTNAWAGVLKYATRFIVLVCPGLTFHEVWMTTGDGNGFTALSVTPAIVCTAPDVTVTLRAPGEVAAREMTRAWAESSRALSAKSAHRARRAIPYLPNRMNVPW